MLAPHAVATPTDDQESGALAPAMAALRVANPTPAQIAAVVDVAFHVLDLSDNDRARVLGQLLRIA